MTYHRAPNLFLQLPLARNPRLRRKPIRQTTTFEARKLARRTERVRRWKQLGERATPTAQRIGHELEVQYQPGPTFLSAARSLAVGRPPRSGYRQLRHSMPSDDADLIKVVPRISVLAIVH